MLIFFMSQIMLWWFVHLLCVLAMHLPSQRLCEFWVLVYFVMVASLKRLYQFILLVMIPFFFLIFHICNAIFKLLKWCYTYYFTNDSLLFGFVFLNFWVHKCLISSVNGPFTFPFLLGIVFNFCLPPPFLCLHNFKGRLVQKMSSLSYM